jgi:hypothetical protein
MGRVFTSGTTSGVEDSLMAGICFRLLIMQHLVYRAVIQIMLKMNTKLPTQKQYQA